jgi:lipopolysaccharide export LptBFGC system permease protein LptF
MRPTRLWPLLGVAVAIAAVTWVLVRETFANLPPLPWTAVPALALLAAGEWLAGRNLRDRLNFRSGKPLQPLAVPRLAAFAKASSAAAAIFGGLALGFGIYTVGSLDKPAPRHDALAAAATLLAAIVLAAAALYLERSCRAPEPPDDDSSSSDSQHGRGR